jgi:hypothetical protein
VPGRKHDEQAQQQSVGRPNQAQHNLVLDLLIALRPPPHEHGQGGAGGDQTPKNQDSDDHS